MIALFAELLVRKILRIGRKKPWALLIIVRNENQAKRSSFNAFNVYAIIGHIFPDRLFKLNRAKSYVKHVE